MQRPVKEKVFLASINREVLVGFISLRDDDWMQDKFGKEKILAAFGAEGFDLNVILWIFWRLMDVESKEFILKQKAVQDDENGIPRVVDVADPVERLKGIVSGASEVAAIIAAIYKMRFKSNPSADENVKKKTPVAASPPSDSAST